MSESTKTPNCANCGIRIVSTGEGFTHVPKFGDRVTDCTDPAPASDDGNEMWTLNVWVKPGAGTEVCHQVRELDGVAELYRAYRPGDRG